MSQHETSTTARGTGAEGGSSSVRPEGSAPAPATPRGSVGRRMGVPFLVLGLMLCLSITAALRMAAIVEEQELTRFNELVQSAYQALAGSVENDLNAVRSLQGFLHGRAVATTNEISEAEWGRFLGSLNWRRNYPNHLELGYAPRAKGVAGQPDTFRVLHLDSRLKGSRRRVGLDLAADPALRATIEDATGSTAPTSSPVVNLVGEDEPVREGTVVFLPVFEGGLAPRGRRERREAAVGVVFYSTVTTNVYRSMLGGRTNPVIHLEFEELPLPAGGAAGAAAAPAQGLSPTTRRPDGSLEAILTTEGVGRWWNIRFRSLPEFSRHTSRRMPWVVGAVGGAFSLLVFGLTALQAVGRARADRLNQDLRRSEEAIQRLNRGLERRIEERTAELISINLRLGNEVAVRERSEAALREVEELYRRAIASAEAVPYRRDYATERFTFIGDGIEALTGYPAADVTPQFWASLVEESSLQGELAGMTLDEAVRRVRAGEFNRWRDDCRIRCRDGTVRWVSDSSVEIPGPDGKPVGSVGFLMDITERKRAEVELVKALSLEKELGRLKSQFIATVSHEFRTPLGIILSSAEILDRYFDRLTPAVRREQLAAIHDAVRRMAGLMENVLVLGRVEAGRLDCHPVPIDPRAVCRRVIDEVRSATHGRCPVILETLEGVNATVSLDETLLRHILVNLLSNAVKYSPDESPVTLRLRGVAGETEFVVEDRGIGIPAEDRDRLFVAFHRGQNVGHIAGTGLGLSIVKHCVDRHGGSIRHEDVPGGGTRFVVRLPTAGPTGTDGGTTGGVGDASPARGPA